MQAALPRCACQPAALPAGLPACLPARPPARLSSLTARSSRAPCAAWLALTPPEDPFPWIHSLLCHPCPACYLQAADTAAQTYEAGKQRTAETAAVARDTAASAAGSTQETAAPVAESARQTAAGAAETAGEHGHGMMEAAKERIGEVVQVGGRGDEWVRVGACGSGLV